MRKYISDYLDGKFDEVKNENNVIISPPGSGKTTFVLNDLSNIFSKREKLKKRKILILCNRRLLRRQYWYQVIDRHRRYQEIKGFIELKTYQQLAGSIRKKRGVEGLFDEYCAVILDEFHYFVSDSDFNGIGTYPVLNAIVRAGAAIPMFFFSATGEEIIPLLKDTLHIQKSLAGDKLLKSNEPSRSICNRISELSRFDGGYTLNVFEYPDLSDYDRFKCFAVSDIDTLCKTIADNIRKTVVFIDDKKMAESISEKLKEKGIRGNEIAVISADNIDGDEMRHVVDPLVMTNKVTARVLLTTSVLDNGVSIHDKDVDMIAIVTDSKTSFLQMLGRVRADQEGKAIKLIFLVRGPELFRRRAEKYQQIMDTVNAIIANPKCYSALDIMSVFWDKDQIDLQEIYRQIFVPMQPDCDFLPDDRNKRVSSDIPAVKIRGEKIGLYLNRFAVEKIGNMLITEERFYQAALSDPVNVIYLQMSWIGKAPEELQVLESVIQKEFVEELLKIQGLSFDELTEKKKLLISKFKAYMFPNVNTKNGSISKENFIIILENMGLRIETRLDENRKNRYFVSRKAENTHVDMEVEELS